MVRARVPYRIGREPRQFAAANDAVGPALQEGHAGAQVFQLPLGLHIDPSRVPGDPSSGRPPGRYSPSVFEVHARLAAAAAAPKVDIVRGMFNPATGHSVRATTRTTILASVPLVRRPSSLGGGTGH